MAKKSQVALVQAASDRSVPEKYVGKIEPNYYCRAWKGKKLAYCTSRAGHGTTHPGLGRCKYHGGQQENDGRVKSGRFSSIQRTEIREMMELLADTADPLDAVEELLIAKAYLRETIAREGPIDDEQFERVMNGCEKITRMSLQIEQKRATYAISRPEFWRLMVEMGRQVEAHMLELGRLIVADVDRRLDVAEEVNATLKRIRDGWLSLRSR